MQCVKFVNTQMVMFQPVSRIYYHILKRYYFSFAGECHLFSKFCIAKNYLKQLQTTYSKAAVSSECNDLVKTIMDQNSNSMQLTKRELNKIVTQFYSKGFTTEEIKQKYMDYFGSKQTSYLKSKLLSEIRSNPSLVMPLLSMPLSTLLLVVKRNTEDKASLKNFVDRISYLSHELNMGDEDMIKLLCKHPSLLTMKFTRLENKMKILKNANIGAEHIVKDLWIFNYNEKLLENRIKAATRSGILIKPWLLRCPEEMFNSMLEKWVETTKILDGVDEVGYLAKKLDCSIEYITHMMDKNRLLKTINVPKLEKVINFLYEKGYTPEEVRLFPRVFCSSVDTLSKRFEEFRGVKGTMPTMSQLCFSSKKHEEFLNKQN